MIRRKALALFIAALPLAACGTTNKTPASYYAEKKITPPNEDAFPFCSEYGCQTVRYLTFDENDWTKIENSFGPPATSAQQERENIRQAIGTFEKIIGPRTSTQNDRYGTFMKIGDGQLDCVDESTNTTTYLKLLEQRNLLKHHTIEKPQVRIPIIHSGRWPHQAAAITDKMTGKTFIVDSWFHDNGYPAEILPLETWKEGWKPEEHLRNTSDL